MAGIFLAGKYLMVSVTVIGSQKICRIQGMPSCMISIIIITGYAWINYMKMRTLPGPKCWNVLNQLEAFNTENPNTMINQFFFQGKSTELIKIF